MIHAVLAATLLWLGGWRIWVQRRQWRHHWQHILTVSLILQAVAFALCAPVTNRAIGPPLLLKLTGIPHIGDFLGHVCFIAAASAAIYAVLYRLTPGLELPMFRMRRVEIPSSIAATIMLICIAFSHSNREQYSDDFFDEPLDGWLRIYWLVYGVLIVHLLLYLARLLLILRDDPRSAVSANLLLAGAILGALAIAIIVTAIEVPLGIDKHRLHFWIFAALSIPSTFALAAAGWRLSTRLRSMSL